MPEQAIIAARGCPIDFDHESCDFAANWAATYRALRETNPRPWTDNHGGFWIATKYQDVVAISQQPMAFTTVKQFDPVTGEPKGGLAIPPLPAFRAGVNELEPPEWNGVRGLLNPRFSPKAVARLRDRARHFAAALIDLVIEKGTMDLVEDFTNPLPALLMMELFGFPLHEWRQFADPLHEMVYVPFDDPGFAEIVGKVQFLQRRIDEEIELRRAEPRDDLIGYMVSATIDGKPMARDELQDIFLNILLGGVDTTTALTSNVLVYLARNPEQRQRLIAEPELLPYAREEFIRYFTPLHSLARTAREGAQAGDWRFEKDDRVLLAYASANRDPDIFDNPDELMLDRFPNRHIGFGAGIHHCLGSFVARLMFETMLGEILTRLPDYRIAEEAIAPYPSVGKVNGWIRIPATFTPGPRVDAMIEGSSLSA